jgi:hypothetical protein
VKKAVLLAALLFAAAGYVFLQTVPATLQLATVMPGGALLYLESPDFSRLLRDWGTSQVKADWLRSENYAVFSHSNLLTKLQEVYTQYGDAAGFLPDLRSMSEIAGTDSALALYEIRDVEFLYATRIGNADFMKSQLWAVRDKFEQRQAGGVTFYLRTDPASHRTVAFAFAKGYLLLATRDDLVAQALELVAGGSNPNVASDRWFHDSSAAAPTAGELRLVMNLDALVKSVYFRSYWVQRNASVVRQYWAGVADVRRTGGNITETRVFLRTPGAVEPAVSTADGTVSSLLSLVPPEAGLYKASRVNESGEAAALIVQKLIGPEPQRSHDWRYAPLAVSSDSRAGSEGDLETRIDQQPLPSDAGISDSVAAVRAMVDRTGAHALLLVQSSSQAAGTFIQKPSVIVLDGAGDWDNNSVQSSLTTAAGKLWTTSQIGAGWIARTAGRNPVQRLDGLGTLFFANRGRLLFLSNDSGLLASVLDRAGTAPPAGGFSYAAGFRHSRERANYERVMTALDFASAGRFGFQPGGLSGRAPAFFSDNIGSLSRVLSKLTEIRMTDEERGSSTVQTVVYQMGQ